MDAFPTLIVRGGDEQKTGASATGGSATSIASALSNNTGNIGYRWRCSLCPAVFSTRSLMVHHAQMAHSIVNQYQCSVCNEMQSNVKTAIVDHMNSKHPGVSKVVKYFYMRVQYNEAEENTPIWRRDENKVKAG